MRRATRDDPDEKMLEEPDSPPSEARGHSERIPAYRVCLFLFLLTDVFSGQALGLPLPVGPDRILFGFFLLLLVLDRRTPWRLWRWRSGVCTGLAALVWTILSADLHGTLTTHLGAFAILDRLAVPYTLFALAPVVLSTRRSRVLLLQVLCILGLYLGFTAIFEIIGPQSLVYPRYIVNQSVGISFGRARGPFAGSDADASVMAMCLFAALGLRAVSPKRSWRVTAITSSVVCTAGVLLAFTRAEWIGTAVALVICGLLVPSFRRKVPAALLALAVAIGALLVASAPIRNDVTTRTSTTRSVYDRQNTDAAGIRALKENPLFGIGWTDFLLHNDRYVRQARSYPLTTTDIEVHNVPLSRLTELGLLGGGLWILSALCGPIAALVRRRRTDLLDEAYRVSFVGVAVVWVIAIQFSPFPYALPNALVWLLAGVVMSPLGGYAPRHGADLTGD